MQKTVKGVLFLGVFSLLLLLAACSKAECETNSDCAKPGFTSTCVEEKCVRTPIPGACGNGQCDGSENECVCPGDCGVCSGAVPGSTLLQKTCIDNNTRCSVDVPQNKVKPVSITNTVSSQGNTFKITSTFNQPFNFKKDGFSAKVILENVANLISNIRITGYELSGTDKNKQNVVLLDKDVSKPIPAKGASIQDELHLDLATADLEGSVTNPTLKIDYEYTVVSGGTGQLKTAQILNPFRGITFSWVKPTIDYGCPANCDDNNEGTADSCGPETNFFCEHAPIPGACGNFQCDGNENRCTCAPDCGPCTGSAGQFMDLSCQNQLCLASVRSSVQPVPVSLFDDRNLNVFHLNNRYSYNKPFNTIDDKLHAEFTLYNKQETVSGIRIESIRALDGAKELGFTGVNRDLNTIGSSFAIDLPILLVDRPESQNFVTLTIAYAYTQNGVEKKGTFSKALEKITFITPGSV